MGDRQRTPRIASFRELMGYVREDYHANRRSLAPGFQAVVIYRFGVWCEGVRYRILRAPLTFLYKLASLSVRNFYGIELHAQTRIGRRFRIVHQHGIVIHQRATIGTDCLVRQGVTIGALRSGQRGVPVPVLGDRVQIGAGAVIAGPVTVGDDVTIGPNAVVMTDVPAGSIVASPHSRIMTPPPRRQAAE